MRRKLVFLVGLAFGFSLFIFQSPSGWMSGLERDPQIPAYASGQLPAPQLADHQITVNQIIASGLSSPVQVTHAGDDSGRLFIVEQTGRLRIFKNGQVLATPFLNLVSMVSCCGERGLLGLAFHPSYKSNGYFFVNYTRAGDGATVIARYSVSANPDVADPASARVLLVIRQPYANHNGGQLLFSPKDGYLYIGTGDGGSGGDPQDNAQNINSFLGKILRLNVNSGSPYGIPPDNPFVGRNGLDEIWSIGLRNPWRFSFDRQTGDLYIGDVGQNRWEEVDYQASNTTGGLNFGWRCREGTYDFNFSGVCATLQLTPPIAQYSHSVGHSITGGVVYRGQDFPSLQGFYFYADYVDGQIWSLYKTSTNPLAWSAPKLELDTSLNISSFGENEAGELYITDYAAGAIRRIADVNGPTPQLSSSRKMASTPSANPHEVVTYTIHLTNTGALVNRPILLTDTIPAGLSYLPGSFQASQGACNDLNNPTLTWQGNLSEGSQITLTYQVSVSGAITGSLVNRALVFSPPDIAFQLQQSLSVPRSVLTTTLQDFKLPGTQPGNLHAEIAPSADCDTCHNQPIYDRWRGSMMSQAGRDPLLWAALYIANIDAPEAGDYCLRCHTSKGWLEKRSQPTDGSALQPGDLANGVPCAVCHRLVDPRPSTGDEAAAIDLSIRNALLNPIPLDFVGSAAVIVDPQDRRRGPFSFSLTMPYHSAYQTDFLQQTGDAITRARMCGSCHNVSNPVLSWNAGRGQFWPNPMNSPAPEFDTEELFPVETTFDEWLYSDFARGGVYAPQFAGKKLDGMVKTCQDCHMQRSTGTAVDMAFNPVNRDCQTNGCLPEHIFVGGNVWTPQLLQDPEWRLNAVSESGFLQETSLQAEYMLRKAATITFTLALSDTAQIATLRVTNHTGHKLPTGYAEGRLMWLNLKAFDGNSQLIYESGAYNPISGQLVRDPDVHVYEVKQGLTPELAAFLSQPAGESFHFILNNTVIKDNRIPPQGYTQALYNRPGLRPVGATFADGQYWEDVVYRLPLETARLFVTLYYQTASKEYIDFLRKNGGVDGLALGKLWDGLKSPPKIVAQAWFPASYQYLPIILQNR